MKTPVEIKQIDDKNLVVLVKREIDLSKITEDEFIKYMLEDFKSAIAVYDELMIPINIKTKQNYIEREVNKAKEFADKKYKSDKWKNKYIESVRIKAENYDISKYNFSDRMFFDLKPNKAALGIPCCCIIDSSSNEESLKQAYNQVKDSYYFYNGFGWEFKYDTYSKDSLKYSCRPYIDIILSDSDKIKQQQDLSDLSDAINSFYEGTNYWGD